MYISNLHTRLLVFKVQGIDAYTQLLLSCSTWQVQHLQIYGPPEWRELPVVYTLVGALVVHKLPAEDVLVNGTRVSALREHAG